MLSALTLFAYCAVLCASSTTYAVLYCVLRLLRMLCCTVCFVYYVCCAVLCASSTTYAVLYCVLRLPYSL